LPFRRAKGGCFTDDFGVAHRICSLCAFTKYRRRRQQGRFSNAAAAQAAGAAGPVTPASGFRGAGTPPPVPAGLLSTVRGPTWDPNTSFGTARTPSGPGLSVGWPAYVSSDGAAAPPPPQSSDSVTPDGSVATPAGRPDTERMRALGGPQTAWLAQVPRATFGGLP